MRSPLGAPQRDVEPAVEDEEELVGVGVDVPHVVARGVGDPHVVVVDPGHDARTVDLLERRQRLGQVDGSGLHAASISSAHPGPAAHECLRVPGTVVITGASSGIGLAAAEALARAGDDVVLVGPAPGRLAPGGRPGRPGGAGARRVRAYRADFAVLDEVRELAERINADVESIDVLVNNAGMLAAVDT